MLVANGVMAAFNWFTFWLDPAGNRYMLPLAALAGFSVWILHRARPANDAAYYQAHKDDPEEWGEPEQPVRPRSGWQYRADGTAVPVRFVPTEDPGTFLAVTIDGEPVWPEDGRVTVDVLAPGQTVEFRGTKPS